MESLAALKGARDHRLNVVQLRRRDATSGQSTARCTYLLCRCWSRRATVASPSQSVFLMRALVLLAVAANFPILLHGQAAAPNAPQPRPTIEVDRRVAPIVIDGRLDEPDWSRPAVVTQLWQSTPVEWAPASERSEIWMTYDDDAIYVAARYQDQHADSIMAYLVRRDRSNQSDIFMLYLDPYRDGQNGYQFIVNAAGVQREGTLYADNFQDDTWDAVWASGVERTASGWTIELRVPFSQLRMKDGERQEWGVNFGRGIGRRNEVSYLVPRLRQGAGFVSRFARLEGLDEVRPRARRELLPYVTTKAEVRRADAGDPFFDGRRLTPGVGLDFRFGLGANLQLDGAVNPDFGQVEVDPAVVNLSDFEVFFQERRPFFVEGANIFRFGQGGAAGSVSYDWPTVNPFYSRRIGRPPAGGAAGTPEFVDRPGAVTILGASKLTGRVANWNVGALAAVTGREFSRASTGGVSTEFEVEPRSAYGSLRGQRAFDAGRYGFGFMSTLAQRDFDSPALTRDLNRSALFGGLDGWAGLDASRTWVLMGQFGATQVNGTAERMQRLQASSAHYFQRPDASHVELDPTATSLAGAFGRVQLHKQRGAFTLHSAVGAISPGFNSNDVGFVSRSDHVNAHVLGGWRWTQPGSWYQSANLNLGAFSSWDFGGNRTRLGVSPNGNVQFKNFSSLYFNALYYPEVLDNRATRGGPLMVSPANWQLYFGGHSDPRRTFSMSVGGWLSNVEGARGPGWDLEVDGEWRPATSLNIRFGPYLSRTRSPAQPLRAVADTLAVATFGQRYVFGELDQYSTGATVRVDWIFSPRASLELFVQPLVSSVRYESIRELRRPSSFDLLTYGTEGSTYDATTGVVDPDGPGPVAPFSIGQPSFTFASLRGNAVFRWEYVRGSTFYLVWTQNRANAASVGTFAPGRSFSDLLNSAGEHVLLLKLSYWMSR